MNEAFFQLFAHPLDAPQQKPVLATVKLLPLPGALGFKRMEDIIIRAEQEATALASGGVSAIIIENSMDHRSAQSLDAAATVLIGNIARRLKQVTGLPLIISVLPNDPKTALGIAAVVGASMVRLPLPVGVMVADDGFLSGQLTDFLSYRHQLGLCQDIGMLVDISTRHLLPAETGLPIAPKGLDVPLPPQVSHLYSLASQVISKCPSDVLSQLGFIISDQEITINDLVRLRELLDIPIILRNHNPMLTGVESYRLSSGLLLEEGIRKNNSHGNLPATIDMVKVEELMGRLHSLKAIQDIDPDFFVGENPGRSSQ